MKKVIFFILAIFSVLVMVGCSSKPAYQSIEATVAQSDKPRETTPVTDQADLDTLVKGNNTFALNLFQALNNTDGNMFYSPYSISEALAMTYGGARGTTAEQMAATLQFQLSQERLHPAFNALDIQLAQRGQGAQGADNEGFRLHVVNAIWGQQGFSFLTEYLDLLAQNYGAGLRLLDFVKSPEPSRQTINQWVSEQTEDKIKDLLPQGSIDTDTRLVLTNAIYFNAAWQYQFQEEATADGQFHLLNGSDVTAHMMNQTKSFGYFKGDNYIAVELPYDGRELAMDIIMPDTDQFKAFAGSLTEAQVSGIISSIKYQEVDLSMPKFKFESQFGLKKTLSLMGMTDAFNNADFSGMDGRNDLVISDVVHKAFVSVDENGTEAAAATGVIMSLTAMPAEPVKVTLDHPFVFLIRDIQTGAILFIGQVINPAE